MVHGPVHVSLGDDLHQPCRLQVPHQPEGIQDLLFSQRPLHAGTLVQQRQGVPQAAVRQPCQQRGALRSQIDLLLLRHIPEPPGDVLRRDAPEGELLAAGADGGRHLVELGSGQDEHQVRGGLLQDLQQGVEGRCREHVDLVYDVYPLAYRSGGEHRLIPEGTHLIHAVVGGRVQLQHIQDRAVLDAQAGGTLIARVSLYRVLTVHRPGQDLGAGRLARPPGACEQIGVGEPLPCHLPLEGLRDMGLPRDLSEGPGPPFSIQRLIQTFHPQ